MTQFVTSSHFPPSLAPSPTEVEWMLKSKLWGSLHPLDNVADLVVDQRNIYICSDTVMYNVMLLRYAVHDIVHKCHDAWHSRQITRDMTNMFISKYSENNKEYWGWEHLVTLYILKSRMNLEIFNSKFDITNCTLKMCETSS